MSTVTTTTYQCDKCGKKLSTCDNELDIMTSVSESSYWSRLHIRIFRIHGMNNDATEDRAALCKKCTVQLLTDAVTRVRKGERTTAGTVHSEQEGWE